MTARTGLQTFVALCHRICRLLVTWRAPMVTAINASALSDEHKTEVIAVMDAINTACSSFLILMNRAET